MSCGISYLPPSVPGGGEDLATTLTFGSTTGANNIDVTEGQSIIFNTAAGGPFTGSLSNATLTSNRTWTLPDATGTLALVGSSGIYGGSGNLPAGTTTVTGGGNSLLMSGLGGFAVISTGAGSQFTDDDTSAVAEILALGSAFGVGEAKMRFDDTASGGGNQQISLGGDADIGGLGMIVTDTTGTPKGLVNSADWSSNFVNESLVTKRYVDAQVAANNELSEVLVNGNTTGGTDIIVTSGDKIVSSSGGMEIDLRYGGIDGDYFFGADPVGFTGNWINGYSGGVSGFDGNYFGNDNQAIVIKPQVNQGFSYDAPITVIKQSALGVHYGPTNFNQSPVFISTNNSQLSAGNTNTVIAGGSGIAAKVSGALYANVLRLQSTNNSFDGIFDIGTLTADRTYSFPDVTGTIPSAPTLPANSGQVTWLGTNGSLGLGGMRVTGQTMFPINATTGALTNFGTSLGSTGFAFGQSYFQRTNAATGSVNGHRFYGSGIQASMWAAVGTGGGINIQPSNSKGGIRVSSQTEKGTIITNLGALAAGAETSEHVTVQFSGRGITRHVGQIGTTIEGLTDFASLPDGSMVYINDATAAVTFTSTGLWLKNGGTWEKLSS